MVGPYSRSEVPAKPLTQGGERVAKKTKKKAAKKKVAKKKTAKKKTAKKK